MNARLYDAGAGIFTSVDPVFADMYRTGGLNAYGYVYGNPFSFVDPTGMNGESVYNYSLTFGNGLPDDYLQNLVNEASENHRKNEVIKDDYVSVVKDIHNFYIDDPSGIYEFTEESFQSFVDGEYMLVSRTPEPSYLSLDRWFSYYTADTFIYKAGLASKTFSVNQVNFAGGNLNYLYVGMLSAHYGDSDYIEPAVSGWNLFQYHTGQGEYNLKQIELALPWARNGVAIYETYK